MSGEIVRTAFAHCRGVAMEIRLLMLGNQCKAGARDRPANVGIGSLVTIGGAGITLYRCSRPVETFDSDVVGSGVPSATRLGESNDLTGSKLRRNRNLFDLVLLV